MKLFMKTQQTAHPPPEPVAIVATAELVSVQLQLAPEDDTEAIIASMHQRAETTGSLLEEILHRQEAIQLRDWGINE
jgi:hypothetical protein